MSVTARQVVEALKSRYVDTDPAAPNVTATELAEFLRSLPEEDAPADHELLETISSNKSDWIPAAAEIAILSAVRDCSGMIFKMIDVDDQIEVRLRAITPILAAEILNNPVVTVAGGEYSIFSVLDLLIDASIGWSSDQGRAGEKLLAEVTAVADAIRSDAPDFKSLETSLSAFLEKEQSRIQKLEERLAASETGKLRSQRGRTIAGQMINDAIQGNELTESILSFLKGPWYESMQLIAITKGVDGDEWIRASKLTETIIWTYQPIEEEGEKANAVKQRLYRIIEHLPSEIRELLLALEHSSDDTETAMDAIDEDHIAIVSGQELEYIEFEPLEVEGDAMSQGTSVSKILLRKVNAMEPGQWFTYEDEDKIARIKLVLKLTDVKQMLFTNRNGMKALDKSFDEVAYLMSSSVIKPLNHSAVFSSSFSTFFTGLIEEHQKRLKAAEEADQEEAAREAERQKAIQEANERARAKEEQDREKQEAAKEDQLEAAREEADKPENQERVEEIRSVVNSLNVGAWLKLPAADGELEECKLAVRVASADKMIFVSRTGVKMGDYTSEQLVTMLVAGLGEIEDAGVDYEDTLAQVVTKLRQDRNKSYDDLTGA